MTGPHQWTPRSLGPESSPAAATALGVLVAVQVLVFWPSGLDQFSLPKHLLLIIGVPLTAAVLFFWRARTDGGGRAPGIDRPLVMLVGLYSAWSIVAPFWHAQNRVLHLMGAGEVLLLAGLFGVTVQIRRGAGPRALERLTMLIAVPVIGVAVFAVAQSVGADPMRLLLDLSSSRPGRWQVLTTLGNPTWTAEVIAICFAFVMLVRVFGRDDTALLRSIRVFVALLLTAGVAVTGSRGGLLGLAVSASSLWFLCRRDPGRGKSSAKAAVVGLGVIACGVLFAMAAGAARLADLEPLTGRLGLWAAGGAVLAEAPITGAGLGHTALVLPNGLERVVAGVDPDLRRWLPTLIVDRLDNDWLQVSVERGGPAGLVLLALWLRATFLAGRRSLRHGSSFDAAVASSLLALGFFASISAPLHTPATAVLFWVLIGLAAASPGADDACQPSRRWQLNAGAFICSAITVIVCLEIVPVQAANVRAGDGHRLLMSGQPERAGEPLEVALEVMPWLTAASIDRARALLDSGRPEEALVVVDDGKRWASSEWFWAVEARALDQLGLPDQAQRVLDEAQAVLPRSPVLLEARAMISSP